MREKNIEIKKPLRVGSLTFTILCYWFMLQYLLNTLCNAPALVEKSEKDAQSSACLACFVSFSYQEFLCT